MDNHYFSRLSIMMQFLNYFLILNTFNLLQYFLLCNSSKLNIMFSEYHLFQLLHIHIQLFKIYLLIRKLFSLSSNHLGKALILRGICIRIYISIIKTYNLINELKMFTITILNTKYQRYFAFQYLIQQIIILFLFINFHQLDYNLQFLVTNGKIKGNFLS